MAGEDVIEARLAGALREVGTGGIGFVGCDVPVDVLRASGRWFGHLPWRTDGLTSWADQWLESSFPFWSRAILEQWHAGAFDSLELVVFSRADDASQRLYYYIRELQRRGLLAGPEPFVFDIALIGRASSLAHTAASIASLAQRLDIDANETRTGIDASNEVRRRLFAIHGARRADGPFFERLRRAALWSDAAQWIDDVAVPSPDAHASRRRRVLLAGSFPPDDRIHAVVEHHGASIVGEFNAHAFESGGTPLVDSGKEPFESIAQHLIGHSAGPRSMRDRAEDIVRRAQDVHADAVVIWLTREDEALAWMLPMQVRALREQGFSVLALPAAHWAADDDVPARLATFVEEIVNATT